MKYMSYFLEQYPIIWLWAYRTNAIAETICAHASHFKHTFLLTWMHLPGSLILIPYFFVMNLQGHTIVFLMMVRYSYYYSFHCRNRTLVQFRSCYKLRYQLLFFQIDSSSRSGFQNQPYVHFPRYSVLISCVSTLSDGILPLHLYINI